MSNSARTHEEEEENNSGDIPDVIDNEDNTVTDTNNVSIFGLSLASLQ